MSDKCSWDETAGRCSRGTDGCPEKHASELAAPPCSPIYWRSCAEWPEGLVNNVSGEGKNVSKDRHDTKEQADAVCSILHVQGLGGERCHFPVRTWVEPVYSENDEVSHAR